MWNVTWTLTKSVWLVWMGKCECTKISLATKRNEPTRKLNKQTKKLSQPTTTLSLSLSIYQHCDVFWVIITVA